MLSVEEPPTTPEPPPADAPYIGLRPNQLAVFNNPARFRVVVAGRRFGKTHLALLEMMRAAGKPNRVIWYVAPTYDQAKRILWSRLKTITEPFWASRPMETELTVKLHGNSSISLKSADHEDSMRGNSLDFVVLDEYASMKPSVWPTVLRPSLTDRQGSALFLGTPKGSNHFYDLYKKAQSHEEWAAFQFTTTQGGNVTASELTSASADLDSESFRQEFEAAFTGAGAHRVYYAFDPALNVQSLDYDPYLPLVWAIDFNVDPMCMLLIQRSGDSAYVLEEIILKDANTEKACQTFHQRVFALTQEKTYLEVYGDASGNQRRTSASATDWTIIRKFLEQCPNRYTARFGTNTSNPQVRDRVNCVNSRLQSSSGEPRLFIDPACRELIRDLEQVTWLLDSNGRVGNEIDKSDRLRTHSSDALGYYIAQAFPLRGLIGPKSNGPIL